MKHFGILVALLAINISAYAQAKYVFYFIGDGIGTNQILGAEMYRSALQGEPLGRIQTHMTQLPYSGQISTHSATNGVTDSGAAGTCLATGIKTRNGIIGLGMKGDTLLSITDELKAKGWGIGIITTVGIDHATPSSFYAHSDDRNDYYQIGQQLCKSDYDFVGGAGFHHPRGYHSDKPCLYGIAEAEGYQIAYGYPQAQSVLASDSLPNRLIMVQAADSFCYKHHGSNLRYSIDRKEGDLSLSEIVQIGIPFMSRQHERFFMMIEGGMIDYACHGNDGRTAIEEVWDMSDAMKYALDFYHSHPEETLILVVADHESGGMSIGRDGDYTLHLDLLQYQQCSSWVLSDLFSALFKTKSTPTWQDVQDIYRTQLGFWEGVEISAAEEKELKELYLSAISNTGKDTHTMYKTIHQLGDAGIRLLNKKARVGWTSHSHTAHAVPVFAIGVGAERFSGWHDNTEIVPLIRKSIE